MRNFPRTDGGRPVGASQQPAGRCRCCESAENTFARDSNTQKHERTMQSALSGGGVGSPQWVINVIARCVRRAGSTAAAARIFINAPVCAVHADCTSTRRVSRLHTWIMLPLCTRVHDQQRMCVTLRWLLLDLCASANANSEKMRALMMLFASGSQRASRENLDFCVFFSTKMIKKLFGLGQLRRIV